MTVADWVQIAATALALVAFRLHSSRVYTQGFEDGYDRAMFDRRWEVERRPRKVE